MSQTSAAQVSEQDPDGNAVRPFQFNFPDTELYDLRRRFNATRWPEREVVADASQGVQLAGRDLRCTEDVDGEGISQTHLL